MPRGAAAVLVIATVVACTPTRPECHAGEYHGCTCEGGKLGYAECRPDIDGYGACVCDGTTPGIDAGRPDVQAADARPTKKALYETCASNDDCESALCAGVPGQGRNVCSKACTQATAKDDCPPPSTGCNAQNRCSPP